MVLTPQGLVLGAGTVLLPAEGARKLKSLKGSEQQVLALLSAAYGTAVAPTVLDTDSHPQASAPPPPVPAATVYEFELLNAIVPTVCTPSSVTVLGAVMLLPSTAVCPWPFGTPFGVQFVPTLHEPPPAWFHVGTGVEFGASVTVTN